MLAGFFEPAAVHAVVEFSGPVPAPLHVTHERVPFSMKQIQGRAAQSPAACVGDAHRVPEVQALEEAVAEAFEAGQVERAPLGKNESPLFAADRIDWWVSRIMPSRGIIINSVAGRSGTYRAASHNHWCLNVMSYQVRDVNPASVSVVHHLNENALPHVNSMPVAYFRARVEDNSYFRAVFAGERPVAFLLAMNEAADYDSLNFLWFREHYDRFVYIDRVVVDPGHRRCGYGATLYEDLARWSAGRTPRLACEVNLRPPNEPSMRFHRGQGFVPVGTQETDGGRKTVSLMVREFDES